MIYFYGMKPSVASISFIDYPSPYGHSVGVYFTGCHHMCKGCQNPELQEHGQIYEKLTLEEFISLLKEVAHKARTNKVVLLGGDPLDPQNREFTKSLIESLSGEFDFCVYTGNRPSEEDMGYAYGARFIKFGVYKEDLKQDSVKTGDYMQFASSNQELYRMNEETHSYDKVTENGRYYFNE